MREAARKKTVSESISNASENIEATDATDSVVESVADSGNTQNGSVVAPTESSVHSDGLLLDDHVIDQLLETVVTSVQESLSSEIVNNSSELVVQEQSDRRARYIEKRDSEIAGLRAAISNAVEKGSCSSDKLSIVDQVASQPRPPPESPPDAPRDPRDRRKRLRSGCFRYVSRADTPNTLQSLITELKLVFKEPLIGLNLSEIFAALEGHPDAPLTDSCWGVSPKTQPDYPFLLLKVKKNKI